MTRDGTFDVNRVLDFPLQEDGEPRHGQDLFVVQARLHLQAGRRVDLGGAGVRHDGHAALSCDVPSRHVEPALADDKRVRCSAAADDAFAETPVRVDHHLIAAARQRVRAEHHSRHVGRDELLH